MIDRGEIQIEWRAAIDAAAAAVAHHGAFHGALVLPPEDLADLSLEAARRAWEWNAVSAMLRHCTSQKHSDARRRVFPVPGVANGTNEMTERALRARRVDRTSE
jgi:hypothetical protein